MLDGGSYPPLLANHLGPVGAQKRGAESTPKFWQQNLTPEKSTTKSGLSTQKHYNFFSSALINTMAPRYGKCHPIDQTQTELPLENTP
jgi:hypothetical protein